MELTDQIYLYEEKMLRIQYNMSECITHKLTKGEIREDYIKQFVSAKIPNIRIEKGFITHKEEMSSQLDFIICKENAIIHRMGQHSVIKSEDCKHIFEIKSKINMSYINKLSNVAKIIKNMNKNIKIGIIGYKLLGKENTILKNFGFIYDKEIEAYEYDSSKIKDEVKNIDYVISLDEKSEFIIVKSNQGFIFIKDYPIIKYFINLLNEQ